jgi:type-F conjugative transfer system pilin assembly protein TrbC
MKLMTLLFLFAMAVIPVTPILADNTFPNDAELQGAMRQAQEQFKQFEGTSDVDTAKTETEKQFRALDGYGMTNSKIEVLAQKMEKLPDVDSQMEKIKQAQSDYNNQNLYIFVSFSMDTNYLRELGSEAERIGGVLVIRGFVDNKLSLTLKKIRDVFQLEKDSKLKITIDPKAYKKYEITRVPTFVLVDRGTESDTCENRTSCSDIKYEYTKISGKLSLRYALEAISRLDENLKSEADRYLTEYRL